MKKTIKRDIIDRKVYTITDIRLIYPDGKEVPIPDLVGKRVSLLEHGIKEWMEAFGYNYSFNVFISKDGKGEVEILDEDGLKLSYEYTTESLPDIHDEIEVEFSDSIKNIDVNINDQTLSFKFRDIIKKSEESSVLCERICPYGNRDCGQFPDPRHPGKGSFLDFCGEVSEISEETSDLIPEEGTIEEEFKKIGIDI